MWFKKKILLFTFWLSAFSGLTQSLGDYHDFKMQDATIEQALDSLSQLSQFNFSYNSSIFPEGSLYSFDYKDKTITQILSEMVVGLNIEFNVDNDQIILKRVRSSKAQSENIFFSISGYVKEDEGSDEFVPGVNVYLDGTTLGSITGENGRFLIERVPIGSYKIIFSHLSYEKLVYDFSKSTSSELFVNVKLKLATNLLEDIEIVANLDRKEKKFNDKFVSDFKTEFLGTSSLANDCVLINPQVLKFEHNRNYGALFATAMEPVVIQNNGLGYNLYCDLNDFFSTESSVRFTGEVRFEELIASDTREERKWRENRKEAYKGSIQHFFKSFIDGTYRKEGFRIAFIDQIDQLPNRSDFYETEDQLKNLLTETGIPFRWEVNIKNILYVVYLRELESSAYLHEMEKEFRTDITNPNKMLFIKRSPQNQRSVVELEEGPVYVDINGNVLNPEGLSISGYWAWERLADLVPSNYVLAE